MGKGSERRSSEVVCRNGQVKGNANLTIRLPHVPYNEVLLPAEKKAYRIAEAPLKHNVKPKEEEAPEVPEVSEDSDGESLSSKEIQEIQS